MTFKDRADAGRRLACRLADLRGGDAVVLAVVHGGAPVALEVARALALPLDVVVVERIEDPFMSGVTIGAVAEGGITVFDAAALHNAGIAANSVREIADGLFADVDQRARAVRAGRAPVTLAHRTALIVDDGVAVGVTARAAARAARARGAQRVVLAVPVAAADAVASLGDEIEETVCIENPPWVPGIGRWYQDYPAVTDEEVAKILRRAGVTSPYRGPRREHPAASTSAARAA